VQNGANIEAVNNLGRNLFHRQIFQFISSHFTCYPGKTPMHVAASQARDAICEYLIASGAQLNR
jgi:ankyrin repeat protein